MRSKTVSRQEIWLMQRVKGLLSDCELKPLVDKFGRSGAWTWIGIYLDGIYCGGFGFDEAWIRVDVPTGEMSPEAKIPCPANLRQQLRAAVNQAIAELAEQQLAA